MMHRYLHVINVNVPRRMQGSAMLSLVCVAMDCKRAQSAPETFGQIFWPIFLSACAVV